MAGLASCADWTRGRGGGEPCAAACVGPCADPRVAQARTLKINSRRFASRLLGSTSESPPLWAAQTPKVRGEGIACEVAELVRPRGPEGRNCEARWRPHLGLRPAASGAGLGPIAASAPVSGLPHSGGRPGRPAARALGPEREGLAPLPRATQASFVWRRGLAPLGPRRGESRAGLAPRARVAGTPGTGRCDGASSCSRWTFVGRAPGGGLAGHVPAAAGPQDLAGDEARARRCKALGVWIRVSVLTTFIQTPNFL